jgi:hypothetical protein
MILSKKLLQFFRLQNENLISKFAYHFKGNGVFLLNRFLKLMTPD